MRLRPSGSCALLVEVDGLDEVLALHAALVQEPLPGVVDVVPAASTVLLVLDPAATTPDRVGEAVRRVRPRPGARPRGDDVEVPVRYDGEDVDELAGLLGCDRDELVARHTGTTWTVAFCGFAPGFGYLTADHGTWDVPRRATPRTRVPAGSVALAGPYSGVYPRASPGGWQLLGSTDLRVLDPGRDPVALLRPGARVRFVEVAR